ncbi:MAG: prephenate dehydratase [Planctomycetia bacterium]|nr:prephenate dehydratase [Planctomycetia bacterium]
MAKRKKSTKPATPPADAAADEGSGPTLAGLRRQIDGLDREILQRINQRAKFALKIGELKNGTGQTIYAPDREEQVLGRVAELNEGPLSERCIRAVFREVISGSRAVEKILRVAFLGPAYSYSHLAAIHRFGQSVEFLPVGTIGSVFEEVSEGQADYGLVPIENSTDGRIADTLDNFTRYKVRICAEVQLRIHHNLLARCRRSEVKEIYSKPQALSQCRKWLSTHLPMARTVEVTSTSTAAQLANEKPGAAAIASAEAGIQYGLDVLAADIEDNPDNITRFAVISHQTSNRSGTDSTLLMLQIADQPGSLVSTLAIFKKLNLSRIESFPIAGSQGSYWFFIELVGHQQDPRVRRAIERLKKKALRIDVLGSYARSAPVG